MSASVEAAARAPLGERLGDRINPLVVKEIRQGLRTRVFWVCFGLMLLACLLLSLMAYADVRDGGYQPRGQTYFFTYFVCLGLVHFFVIPYSAYRSLAREREDETWVLLALTGLGPRRILRGKVTSFLAQAVLYASAVGPFLLFSYYLNGIDLPTILVVLALGAAWLVFLTVLGVCAATLADGRLGRAFVHFVVLGLLAGGVVQGLVGAFAISDGGSRLMRDNDFPYVISVALWLMLGYGWLLFETAAARLSLITEDYSRGPRRALALQMLLSAVGVTIIWWAQGQERTVAAVSGVVGSLHLTLVGLFLISDVDGQARALRVSTRPWSLLRPGAVRGFRLVVLLFMGWALFCTALHLSSSDTRDTWQSMLFATVAAAAYPVLFFSVALLVAKMPKSDRLSSPVAVRILFISLAGLTSVVFPLVALLADVSVDDPIINLLNPIVGLVNFGSYEYSAGRPKMNVEMLLFICVVAGLSAFAADRALVERERRIHAS
ncbi:ABC transporter permease [Hyalangium rubrum]|uniref:ABC transporter permease n=1 Tax=Hyalangium rubrum TaxID=3103134 RepID=A0ABU5H1Z8_9BACT|nr:ABC transporter permease [Hyalangium sp. s54d21]MDY7227480.1 ABC transporter permease [Hyalangium sp. s54d21]